ncbi:MAG: FAD:protein FMN transferase [Thermomicrobiales bacterium]|nr:MAG: FAD:protein FMN transferase [Thermomicrobiales bacterium]
MNRTIGQTQIPAMGTAITIIGVEISAAALHEARTLAIALASAWDALFNRFREDSEISRLNRSGGQPVSVSPLFLDVLEEAMTGVRMTGGRFNPAVLPALEAAGYDRNFADLKRQAPRAAARADGDHARGDLEDIVIDRGQGAVCLPPGMRLDFGGIAKGLYVDRLAALLSDWPGGCVDAGGDVRVWGLPPDGAHWRVGIEDPTWPGEDLLVAEVLRTGAAGVATSGSYRRWWRLGDRIAHHLIDPATGQPLTGVVVAATVFAPSVARAEIMTKSLLVAASRDEPLSLPGCALAVLIASDGTWTVVAGDDVDAVALIEAREHRQPA